VSQGGDGCALRALSAAAGERVRRIWTSTVPVPSGWASIRRV